MKLAFAAAAIVCGAVLAAAQATTPIDAALVDLASPDLHTRDRALRSLLAQSGVEAPGQYAARVKVNSLLRAYPQQAERIKITLIAALERQGADHQRRIQETKQPLGEEFGESWKALAFAVAGLQDPRAVNGLLWALPAGSADGLADICPAAVDALADRIHQPDLYVNSAAMGYRRQAITALGWCAERPAMMRLNPEILAQIRVELLADLDDPDWAIRAYAVDALSALRTDPEVRAKLQIVATTDPYVAAENKHVVRDGASTLLSPDAFSFFVTQTSDTRECRIQPTSEAPIVQQFIGPERKAVLKPLMCSHYDPTGKDPSLCWKVEPAGACSPSEDPIP